MSWNIGKTQILALHLAKTLDFWEISFSYCVSQHLLKCVYILPQFVCLHGFYMNNIKLYDTQMISETNQCFHRKLAWVSWLSLIFNVLIANSMYKGTWSKFSIHTLQILPCPPCQLGPFKASTMVMDDGTQMTHRPCAWFKYAFCPFH